ncbi:N-formylglutamate amidohydrolase [Pararhodobacter sp. SW119]|uniref:N-formylglutamate amidohydrolase n=1 Tax=Pararhodobacter sp. SW119 TaxID=2780075 RepID=UPI001AE0BD50|nr:N-formylglutamate amidohydrolase [Pararhodobacter sp. SW119]
MRDPVLTPDDPPPVVLHAGGSGWVISVEHGGFAVPARLGGLGLPLSAIRGHIGWDPGAADVAHRLRARLDGTLVLQPYSRLVIDCNRPQGAPDLMAQASDGVEVPGNAGLDAAARAERWEAIHQPFHGALAQALNAAEAGPGLKGLLSVHSFTPQRATDPAARPWPVGLLWRQENALAHHLATRMATLPAAQPLGINEPYRIETLHDYTLPVHAEPQRRPHVLIEFRNDLIATPETAAFWADCLADLLANWSQV